MGVEKGSSWQPSRERLSLPPSWPDLNLNEPCVCVGSENIDESSEPVVMDYLLTGPLNPP